MRKHAGSVAAVLLIAAVVVLGFVASTTMYFRAERARQEETVARAQAQRLGSIAQGYAAQMKLAHAAFKDGKTGGALALLRVQRPSAGEPDFRGFDWRYLYGLCLSSQSKVLATNASGFQSVDYSPDGRTLAFGTCDGFVELFDPQTRQHIKRWRAHEGAIDYLAFYPRNNNWLATGGADERVVLWDVKRQEIICTNRSDFIHVTTVAFTPDGKSLFASSIDQNIRSWNVQDTAQTNLLRGHSAAVYGLAIAPDGRSLASASNDGTARLWYLQREDFTSALSPREEFITLFPPKDTPSAQRQQLVVFGVAVSPAQDRAVAAENLRLISCDLGTGTVLTTVGVTNVFEGIGPGLGFARLAFAPYGRELAARSSDGRLAFLDVDTLQSMRAPIKLHNDQISHIAYALNGTVLVTGGGWGTGIKLTDVASGRNIASFDGIVGSFPMQPLAVSRDGKRLATGSPQGEVCVWDIASHRLVAGNPQKVRFIHEVVFSPDGKLLAFTDERGVIFLWDLSGQQPPRKLVGHAGLITMMVFSPDGRTLASASIDHTIRLWCPEIDQEVAILTGHSEWVWCIAFAEHGDALLSGRRDGTLKLWRALSFEEIESRRCRTD